MATKRCAECKVTFDLSKARVERLTELEWALCVKHGLDLTKAKKVTCPFCGTSTLCTFDDVGTPQRGGQVFVCVSCRRKLQTNTLPDAYVRCPQCGGVALNETGWHTPHVRFLAEVAGSVSRVASHAFDTPGPLYNEARHHSHAKWLGNLRHNIEAAINGFMLKIDAGGTPISNEGVRTGLRRMCESMGRADMLQRLEDVCGPTVATELRAIFRDIRTVAEGSAQPARLGASRDAVLRDRNEIAQAFRNHFNAFTQHNASKQAFQTVAALADALGHGAKARFAVDAVMQLWPEAEKTGGLQSTGKEFPDCFVAVDVLPVTDPAAWPSCFGPEGYLEHLNVFNPDRVLRGQAFAAWCYCCDGETAVVHLTFMGPRHTFAVVAQDLLMPESRADLGL